MAKIKTGRRASADERARAARLIKLYRLAQASPDGRHCLNPQDESECQAFIDETDPEPLLLALESFVEQGTFAVLHDLEPFLMRMEMKALRATGIKSEATIAQLAEEHNMSDSTARRRVKSPVKS
jgi:hypothetical protein